MVTMCGCSFDSDTTCFPGVEAVYYLESVSIWRKYLWVFDLPFTLFFSSIVCVLGPLDILRAQVNQSLY